MLNIIERLDRKKYTPVICVLKRGGELEKVIEVQGIPIIEAPFYISPRPLWNLLSRARQAAAFFKDQSFQIFHSFHWAGDYTEPLIAHFAGAKWIYTKKNMNWGRNWFLRTLLADKVAARNTAMMRTFLNSFLFRHKCELIQGGVDALRFSKKPLTEAGFRRKMGIGKDEFLAVCVAQLTPVKGQHLLLEAASKIPGLHVGLAGKPLDVQYAKDLENLCERLKIKERIHFLGGVSDVAALLAQADIFVLPTTFYGRHEEGCPVALLEAMAGGKACVASDVAGSGDLIQSGQNGLLFKPENTDSLVIAINELKENQEKRFLYGEQARKTVVEKHSLELEAEKMKMLYESLL